MPGVTVGTDAGAGVVIHGELYNGRNTKEATAAALQGSFAALAA